MSAANEPRVRMGPLQIDPVTSVQALERIEALVLAKEGGCVFTPNVDHVVLAESNEVFRAAYARASLSLVDGMPVLWASHLLGRPLPEKISGSDLVWPLMERAAARRWRVYLLGGQRGAAAEAAQVLRDRLGVDVVGTDDSIVRTDGAGEPEQQVILERIRFARPDLLLVALGAPKQEFWISHHLDVLRPAVALGVGASVDFIAGRVPRAPRWMSKVGLEWSYRLLREPRRLWRRYLVDDPKFLFIVARELRSR